MEVSLEHLKLIPDILKELEVIRKNMTDQSAKRWMNVRELAEYLGYSRDRLYKIKEEFLIEGIHFHNRTGKILFDRVAIDSWVVGKETDDALQSQRQVVDNVLSSIKKVPA